MFENLERRAMLTATVTDGVLTIVGTELGDDIRVGLSRNGHTLTVGLATYQPGWNYSILEGPPLEGIRFDLGATPVTKIVVHCGGGNDSLEFFGSRVRGMNIPVEAYGGKGHDGLRGGGGNDSLFGGAGGDYLRGFDGDDVLRGGVGDDELRGDGGADAMYGEDGNDILDAVDETPGLDLVDGGTNEPAKRSVRREAPFDVAFLDQGDAEPYDVELKLVGRPLIRRFA